MNFPELSEKRKRFFQERLAQNPELGPLRDTLLSISGLEIVPRPESDLDIILKRGAIWDNDVQMVAGHPSYCHGNVAYLYITDPASYNIVVGWGLSDDGLWRQHSWIMDGETLIETTEERLIYFGVELNKNEADRFVFNIFGDTL